MKTRKFISLLRATVERAALGLFLLMVIIFALRIYPLYLFAFNHWHFGAGLILFYIVLTVSEDYLNEHILHFSK